MTDAGWTQEQRREAEARIAANVARLRGRIDAAARRSGRAGGDVAFVAVTKTQEAWAVNAALRAGVAALGGNRVQELLGELPALELPEGMPVHLIGHLQTNKVRAVLPHITMLQSLDSVRLAQELSRRAEEAGRVHDELVEVNISGEASKPGAPAE